MEGCLFLEPPEMDVVDPYDLLDAVDILSKLPKDFYENMVRTRVHTYQGSVKLPDRDVNETRRDGGPPQNWYHYRKMGVFCILQHFRSKI